MFAINADGNEFNPIFFPSHLNDAAAPIVGGAGNGGTIDVSGGWRDAGDAIKFTVTTAISSVMLDYAARFDDANAELLGLLSEIGVRWLEKAHPPGSPVFIAQVSGESDHRGGFRDFSGDDINPNPAFSRRSAYGQAGSGSLGAGAAGLASAAIRVGVETERGQALIALAKEWYDRGVAVSAAGPPLEGFAQPGGESFSDWQGFMALAATKLFRAGAGNAIGDPYLTDAAKYLLEVSPGDGFSPYFSVGGLAAADLAGGMGSPAITRDDVLAVAQSKLGEAVAGARFRDGIDAFGSLGGFYFGWISDHAGSAALLAAADRAGVAPDGLEAATLARDYILGLNPWGASFLVGAADRDAHNPHHSLFLRGNPSNLGSGLVVGGPAISSQFSDFGIRPAKNNPYRRFNPTYKRFYGEQIVYEDRRGNFITSEVGLAYSAAALLLFASLV